MITLIQRKYLEILDSDGVMCMLPPKTARALLKLGYVKLNTEYFINPKRGRLYFEITKEGREVLQSGWVVRPSGKIERVFDGKQPFSPDK
jgi:hypothetical protein